MLTKSLLHVTLENTNFFKNFQILILEIVNICWLNVTLPFWDTQRDPGGAYNTNVELVNKCWPICIIFRNLEIFGFWKLESWFLLMHISRWSTLWSTNVTFFESTILRLFPTHFVVVNSALLFMYLLLAVFSKNH